MRLQDGGHLVHGRLRSSRNSSLSESPRASPLGPLEKSASGHRWVLVAPHDSGSYDGLISPPAAQRQDNYEAASEAAAHAAPNAASLGFLPPPAYSPAVASAARPSGKVHSDSDAQATEADSGSGGSGLGSFVNRLRDGFGARRQNGSKRDEAGSAGAQMHMASNGEAVEMVTFMETVSEGEGLDLGAAYQMVALRRPTLAQSGIEPSEAQFLLDQANGMLPQSHLQPLMQDNALTALADGIVLWCEVCADCSVPLQAPVCRPCTWQNLHSAQATLWLHHVRTSNCCDVTAVLCVQPAAECLRREAGGRAGAEQAGCAGRAAQPHGARGERAPVPGRRSCSRLLPRRRNAERRR